MSNIYEPKGRAREYSPLALNLYHGCTHGCVYCYVPKMFRRWNGNYKHSDCYPSVDFAELEKSAKKYEGCGKQILLSFTGDPYCGVDPETTTQVLKILLQYNHKVAILTKGGSRLLKDVELFKKFGDRIKVGATLSLFDRYLSEKFEPNAAPPQERVEVLRYLAQEGVKTWASFEPVIFTRQALLLLEDVKDFINHVKVGKINGMSEIEKSQDWHSFVIDFVTTCRNSGVGIYVKDSLRPFLGDFKLFDFEVDMDYLSL